jgi:hypothetical protein
MDRRSFETSIESGDRRISQLRTARQVWATTAMGRMPQSRVAEAIRPWSLSGGCRKCGVFVSKS